MSEATVLPVHVGIVLDGNRRWAKSKGMPAVQGHRQGMDVLKDIVFHAFDNGVQYLSAFIFSTENWQRTEDEVSYLMDLVVKAVEKYLDEFDERGVKIVILGRQDNVSTKVLEAMRRAEEKTKDNTKGTLALCFNYGGKDEILDAVKSLVAAGVQPDDVTDEAFSSHLYHPEIPPVDLLIRTSGEHRTSGFMLYRAAYAELLLIDKYWPDFSTQDFDAAIAEYADRERRFGV